MVRGKRRKMNIYEDYSEFKLTLFQKIIIFFCYKKEQIKRYYFSLMRILRKYIKKEN
jgi:hypothetical protein